VTVDLRPADVADAAAAIYNQGIAEREATFEPETRPGGPAPLRVRSASSTWEAEATRKGHVPQRTLTLDLAIGSRGTDAMPLVGQAR
jgi:hypothetical protein